MTRPDRQPAARDIELLSAYIDDALSAEERTALEARLQQDAALRRELEALRRTVALIQGLPELQAPRDFTLSPADVAGTPPAAPSGREILALPVRWQWAAAAAVLLLVLGLGVVLTQLAQPGTAVNGTAVADAPTTGPAEAVLSTEEPRFETFSLDAEDTGQAVPAVSPPPSTNDGAGTPDDSGDVADESSEEVGPASRQLEPQTEAIGTPPPPDAAGAAEAESAPGADQDTAPEAGAESFDAVPAATPLSEPSSEPSEEAQTQLQTEELAEDEAAEQPEATAEAALTMPQTTLSMPEQPVEAETEAEAAGPAASLNARIPAPVRRLLMTLAALLAALLAARGAGS